MTASEERETRMNEPQSADKHADLSSRRKYTDDRDADTRKSEKNTSKERRERAETSRKSSRHHHSYRSRSRGRSRSRSKSRSRTPTRSNRHRSSTHHRHSSRKRSDTRSRDRTSRPRHESKRHKTTHHHHRHRHHRHSRSRSRSISRSRSNERHRRTRRDSDVGSHSRRKLSDDVERNGKTSTRRKESRDETSDTASSLAGNETAKPKVNDADDLGKSVNEKSSSVDADGDVDMNGHNDNEKGEQLHPLLTNSSVVIDNTNIVGDAAVNENDSHQNSQSEKIKLTSITTQVETLSTANVSFQESKTEASKTEEEDKVTISITSSTIGAVPAVDVSSIKLDIIKALAEARSTIAVIKGAPSVTKYTESTQLQEESVAKPAQSCEEKHSGSSAEVEDISPSQPVIPTKTAPSPKKALSTATADDEFDMFSMADVDDSAVPAAPVVTTVSVNEIGLEANCDDAEGYYQTTVGEVLNGKYRVLGTVGKGVFSTVLRCQCTPPMPTTNGTLDFVAVKLIRNNDVMREASQMEVKILNELAARDSRDKKHCVRLLDTFEHRNHVALVFETMQMNVREAMKKFGGKGGISIQAVRVFSKHLLIALNHLEACKIVHADIKPDNILLDEKQTTVRLCDFGSAFKMDEGKHDPTPYLVSRFYRAPEIVLGLAYDKAVDMWSVGCCLFEMFTGKVMFPGSTNNEMLKLFMELKGKIPNKMIKKHRAAYIEQFQMEPHFTEDNKFCSRECDRVTGKPILRLMDAVKTKNDLGSTLLNAKSSTDDRKQVQELRNLLERMFTLDPSKRISVREALAHPFVKG